MSRHERRHSRLVGDEDGSDFYEMMEAAVRELLVDNKDFGPGKLDTLNPAALPTDCKGPLIDASGDLHPPGQ